MGLAIPRPAMRNKEARVIQARLDYYNRLIAAGDPQAFEKAKALKFTKAGTVKQNQEGKSHDTQRT